MYGKCNGWVEYRVCRYVTSGDSSKYTCYEEAEADSKGFCCTVVNDLTSTGNSKGEDAGCDDFDEEDSPFVFTSNFSNLE